MLIMGQGANYKVLMMYWFPEELCFDHNQQSFQAAIEYMMSYIRWQANSLKVFHLIGVLLFGASHNM